MNEPTTTPDPKSTRWGRIFKPNQTDGVLLVSGWLILITVATALSSIDLVAATGTGFEQLGWFPCAASVVGCLAALATGIAWGRQIKGVSWILFALCILALFSVGYLVHGLAAGIVFGVNYGLGINLSVIAISFSLAFFVVVWFLTLMLRWVPTLFSRVVGGNRQKIMIGAAAILLVLGVLQNAFYPNGEWLRLFEGPWSSAIFMNLSAFLTFIFLPGWAIVNRKCWWIVLLSLIPTFGVVGFSISNARLFWNPYSMLAAVCTTIATLVFAATLLAIRKRRIHDESGESLPSPTFLFPSIWSSMTCVLLLSAAVGLFAFSQNFDMGTLFSPDLSDRWELARKAGQISRESDNQIRLVRDGRAVYYECKFTESTRPDILDVFDEDVFGVLHFENLNPTIDTGLVRDMSKRVQINGGEITRSQLGDLANNSTHLHLQHLEISQAEPLVKLDSANTFSIYNFEPGQIKNLLESIASFGSHASLYISDQPGGEDWPAIVAASQKIRIFLYQGLSNEVLLSEVEQSQSLNAIWIYMDKTRLSSTSLMRFILENDITISTSVYDFADRRDDYFWDLLFAKHGEFVSHNVQLFEVVSIPLQSFKETMNRNHNAFGWNEAGEITEICIPGGEAETGIESLSELTTLSFDPLWMLPESRFSQSVSFSIGCDLTKLTKLERLYFPRSQQYRTYVSEQNIKFLGSLPRLKHLQIPCKDESDGALQGFDTLLNLESLTLFGLPAETTVSELGTLKKLKKLTLVDESGVETSSTWLAAVKKLLPGVSIEVIRATDWKPDLPPTFIDHLKRKKVELRKKLLDELQ